MKNPDHMDGALVRVEDASNTQKIPHERLEVKIRPSFSIITNMHAPLSKLFELDKESGHTVKRPGGRLYEGLYQRVTTTGPEHFKRILQSLDPSRALTFGVARPEQARIVTKQAAAGREDVIARSKEFFFWAACPGIMLLDYDARGDEVLSIDALLRELRRIAPGFAHAPLVAAHSASTYVESIFGAPVTGEGGKHLYVFVADATDIDRAGEVLMKRTVLAGAAKYIESASGALLLRGLFDQSVIHPWHLCFSGGAACDEYHLQNRPAPEVFNNDAPWLDLRSALPDLTQEEETEYEERLAEMRAAIRPVAPKPAVTRHASAMVTVGLPTAPPVELLHTDSPAVRFAKMSAPAVQGQGGDARTLAVAAGLKDFLADPEDVLQLLIEHFNPRCSPPWSEAELRSKVRAAFQYCREREPGALDPKFDELDDATRSQVAALSEPEPEQDASPLGDTLNLDAMRASAWLDAPMAPVDFVFKNALIAGDVAILAGPSGVSKSTWAAQAAVAVASGSDALLAGLLQLGSPEPGRVLALFGEDRPEILQARCRAALDTHHPLTFSEDQARAQAVRAHVAANFFAKSMVGESMRLSEIRGGVPCRSSFFTTLERTLVVSGGWRMVILDCMSRLFSGPENDNTLATHNMELVERLARKTGAAIMLLHHTSKPPTQTRAKGLDGLSERLDANRLRGASGFTAAARSQINMASLTAGEVKFLGGDVDEVHAYVAFSLSKANYTATTGLRFARRGPGGVLLPFKPSPKRKAGLEDLPGKILETVAQLEAEARQVTLRGFARTYANRWKPEMTGVSQAAIISEIEGLIFDGRIRLVATTCEGNRQRVECLRLGGAQ